MKITIAKTAGFCMGVRRAVDTVLDASNSSNEPICTFGPLIHNPQVLNLLEEKGIPVIHDIPEKGSGTVLIRAHGVPPESKVQLEKAGFKVIDATCPRVIKVQRIIEKYARKGFSSIIIGDKDHPEVVGLNGYANGNGHVVDCLEELEKLPRFEKAIIVAQTTQNTNFFNRVKTWAEETYPHYKVFDTICGSTEKRQAEIVSIAESVDAVIVVGGKNSGNTQRLAELATEAGKKTFHIEDTAELDMDALKSAESIAITAGASTPSWIINKVFKHLEASLIKTQSPFKKKLLSIQEFLIKTNLYLAMGAGCLSYACSELQEIKHSLVPALVAILYVFSMHIFNHLIAINADRYNDPGRAAFYEKYKHPLALSAITAGATGLWLVYATALLPFVLLLIMSITGLSYNLKMIPDSFTACRYKRLRDIPGSKTVLIALAWGIVTAILPALAPDNNFSGATIPAFILATGMVFARTIFFDILDMQGDRIAGIETLPISIGGKPTANLLKKILIALALMLPLSSSIHLFSGLGFFLTLYPVLMFAIFFAYERGWVVSSFRLEFMIETHLILAGAITLLWSIM